MTTTQRRWLQVLACAAVLGVVFWQTGVGGALAGKGAKAIAAHRAAVAAAKPTDPTLRAKTLMARDAGAEEMKKHPERYKVAWSQTYHPTAKDLKAMSWGAKGNQSLGTICSGTLQLLNEQTAYSGWPDLGPLQPPAQSVSVSCVGATVSITWVDQCLGPAVGSPVPPSPGMIYLWRGTYWRFTARVALPGGGTSSFTYGVWRKDTWITQTTPDPPGVIWVTGDVSVTWSIAMTGAYRRAAITQTLPSGTSGLRHPAQRKGEGRWYADANTTVTATLSDGTNTATATGNYGAGSETDITSSTALICSIAYAHAPTTYTPYASITAQRGGDGLALDFSGWTFYRDSGSPSTWIWRGSTELPGYSPPYAEGSQYWKTVPSGNSITIHRCPGIASGAIAFGATIGPVNITVVPRLWRENKDATGVGGGYYRYTDYDSSAGHPFELGLYVKPSQTAKDVSVAPDWDGYTYREMWTWGYTIPDDVWRKFTNSANGIQVKLRKDWLVANAEDVPFTNPVTGHDLSGGSLIDILQPVTFHDLTGVLTAPPWKSDWMTWARVELNLDKPPGTSGTRPSAFIGTGGAVVLGDVWLIGAGGGTVERTLATRRKFRMERFAEHAWPTKPEVSHDWPIQTRANLAIATTGDDPDWWVAGTGVALEDVTDWRMFGIVQLTCTGATEDLAVEMHVTYRTLTCEDPYYLGAAWNFGASGEATAAWSPQGIGVYKGTLDHDTGIVRWDICPKAGDGWLKLELVEKVEFVFPAVAGGLMLTFQGWETVPYDPAHPVGRVRMRNAHLNSDYWGAEVSLDGMPNYAPTYGYLMDSERAEVGYKSTQPWQHDPDSEDTDDPTALKDLARWYNEQTFAETLWEPTWSQTAVDAALKDVDANVLGTPVWCDYDEDWFALHVGTNMDMGTPSRVIYCDCILQGGVRGIAKNVDGATRQTELEDTTISLYYSDDAGLTKTLIRKCGTGYAGEYNIGTGREKYPRTYYLAAGTQQLVGSFVNAEEQWFVCNGGMYWDPFLTDEFGGITWMVAESAGVLYAWYRGSGETDTWQAVNAPSAANGHSRPSIAIVGSLMYVAATKDDGTGTNSNTVLYRSWDRGDTWEEIALPHLGSDLEAGTIAHRGQGELMACGWHGDEVLWASSTDYLALSRDELLATPGTTDLTVCAAVVAPGGDPPRTCTVRHPDGSVLVAVESGGSILTYRMRDHDAGFAAVS